MKMVKSLLLGSAAGLVAVAGAQAADILPVKAKPVQYVKICSLYGVGFYYIPGTDMCLKIGGWIRAEYAIFGNGSLSSGPFRADSNNRLTNNDSWRSRGYITADARNQSEYGTIRSYIALGINDNDNGVGGANGFNGNRAFIQFAGFTFGLSQSFYDFYSVPATAYFGYYPSEDTGDPGWKVAAYTAQFGNGFSATISAEMRRLTQILGDESFFPPASTYSNGTAGLDMITSSGTITTGAGGPGAYGGFNVPDIVGNLRVDQAWGSAQVMAALHEVNPQYYDDNAAQLGENPNGPNTEWGFVVGAGIKLLAPMIGPGDYFQAEVNYTQGALGYLFTSPPGAGNDFAIRRDGNAGYGVLSDGVYGGTPVLANTTSVELTTAWSVNAAYEHFWNKQWRTSLYGGYAQVNYDDLANSMICLSELLGSVPAGTIFGTLAPAIKNAVIPACDNDWSTWWIGSRTQWNLTSDLYVGVDVLYQRLQSANSGTPFVPPIVAAGFGSGVPNTYPGGLLRTKDEDNVAIRFRVHRDFYP